MWGVCADVINRIAAKSCYTKNPRFLTVLQLKYSRGNHDQKIIFNICAHIISTHRCKAILKNVLGRTVKYHKMTLNVKDFKIPYFKHHYKVRLDDFLDEICRDCVRNGLGGRQKNLLFKTDNVLDSTVRYTQIPNDNFAQIDLYYYCTSRTRVQIVTSTSNVQIVQ